MRGFTIDGTHTKSRYQMILSIACGIDANSNVVLLAWALVPAEDESWWGWFRTYLKAAYPCKSTITTIVIFILTRVKLILLSLSKRILYTI